MDTRAVFRVATFAVAYSAVCGGLCVLVAADGAGSAPEPGRMPTTSQPTAVEDMGATEFEGLMASVRKTTEAAKGKPTEMEALLWRRMRAHGEVTEQTLQAVVNTWTGYESSFAVHGNGASPTFPETKRLIGELLPMMSHRRQMAAWLLEKRAELFMSEGDYAHAKRDYEAAVAVIEPLRLDVDLLRLECLVRGGEMALLSGDRPGAEAPFLLALSYDWYKVSEPKAHQAMLDLYLTAGRGIIAARRHNLAALKELYFVPATEKKLGPLLQQAIDEAAAEQRGATGAATSRPATGPGHGS